MNDVIYRPKGRAREYSPWACNIYTKCAHGCKYCYCNRFGDFYDECPSPKSDIVSRVEKQLCKMRPDGQVLLSFMGDPYGPSSDDNASTHDVLELLLEHKVPVAVLTKNSPGCIKDIELFKRFGSHIQIGTTVTFRESERSKDIEPGAPTPYWRVMALGELHDEGIKTFVSMEPLLDDVGAIGVILFLVKKGYVDVFKLGKANNYKTGYIDFRKYLEDALAIIRDAGKQVYVKDDLAAMVPDFPFMPGERDADATCVTWDDEPGASDDE